MTAHSELLGEIKNAIESCYGALAAPRFDFVMAAMDNRPYQALIFSLGDLSTRVDEDTESLVVRLSMVGPYAVVMRARGRGSPLIQRAADHELSSLELAVVTLLEAEGLTLLGANILESSRNPSS